MQGKGKNIQNRKILKKLLKLNLPLDKKKKPYELL